MNITNLKHYKTSTQGQVCSNSSRRAQGSNNQKADSYKAHYQRPIASSYHHASVQYLSKSNHPSNYNKPSYNEPYGKSHRNSKPNKPSYVGKYNDSDWFNELHGAPLRKDYDKVNRISYMSTASDSDSASQSAEELNGFRIVQQGKTLHDDIRDDVDSPENIDFLCRIEAGLTNFATPNMMTGPNSKEISLPTFA